MKLTGYTRLASAEDDVASRCGGLRAAGCTEIIYEAASLDRRDRPKLTQAISHLRPGDTLIVSDLDCVAWSLPQLAALLTSLRDRGIILRSLESPIDTSGPRGAVVLETLMAILSFNDALSRANLRLASFRLRGSASPSDGSGRQAPGQTALDDSSPGRKRA